VLPLRDPARGLPRQTFTVPEVAQLLGISRATAYREAQPGGRIPAIRFTSSRRVVVAKAVVEELLGRSSDGLDGRDEQTSQGLPKHS
jgi:excisionase family DNA binding protein